MRKRSVRETRYEDRPDLLIAQLEIFAKEVSELYGREKNKSRDVEDAIQRLRNAYMNFAMAFALMVEGHDPATRLHLDRTLRWAGAIAQQMGLADLEDLKLGFLLHDVGKATVDVPKEILLKPGPLTEAEWAKMRTHPSAGAQIVSFLPKPALDVIGYHHERWDGEGYPRGKRGAEIPIGARVFSIVDVFDALTNDRPYRRAMPFQDAMEIIDKEKGAAFDPDVVEMFLTFVRDVLPD